MLKDERNLLELLKDELEFLEKGSYRNNPRDLWRPRFFLEDSPSCLNYSTQEHRRPCKECALVALVPPPFQEKKTPCRHIPLNSEGQTHDSLYRTSNDAETEEVFRAWLRSTIAKLKENQPPANGALKTTDLNADNKKGQPLFFEKLSPKCANQSCFVAFSWHDGGRLFRFRPDSAGSESQNALGPRHVRHYWLCESCAQTFTLNYEESQGVILEVRACVAMSHSSMWRLSRNRYFF